MNTMIITSAKYIKSPMTEQPGSILATIDGQECFVPLYPGNRHYDEIMRQVDAGTLTIAEAD